MHICLDIDDTITYVPEFFQLMLAAVPDAEVTIVTFRADEQNARDTLASLEIRYDRLIVSTDAAYPRRERQTLAQWKADTVNRLRPDWFFEDMPEVVCLIDREIKVFMPCDEVIRGWLGDATSDA